MLSEYFFKMEEIPKSILFIGSGYIGLEFAHVAALSGVKVTILDMESSLLPYFDKDIVKMV